MRSKRSKRFNKLFEKLPPHVQKQAKDAYSIFQKDPYYNSLEFKPLQGQDTLYSVRIGAHYRAIGDKRGDTILWIWIGTHEAYNHFTSQL
jgi:mRNA-degrading endonuclease RelE of RelBE toxin-antitoxin system